MQALASITHGPSRMGFIHHDRLIPQTARPTGQRKQIAGVALSLSLLLSNVAWAKTIHLEGVHYQPEGLVIQIAGGKMNAPSIETWPNIRDGVKTELIVIHMPDCIGNYANLQQVGSQETSGHPEVKQFWITPFNTDPKAPQGTQVVLEVETTPEAPEFTPQVLSQGNDQWVITLQTRRPSGPYGLEAKALPGDQQTTPAVAPEPIMELAPIDLNDKNTENLKTAQNPQGKTPERATESSTIPAQSLLTALNQAKQRQAELGAQLVYTQQALAQSHAREDALQNRLNGYENILEEAGIDSKQDERLEAKAVIQNLRSALVKVAQKLKIAEEALATRQSASTSATTAPFYSDKKAERVPPIVAFSVADEPSQAKAPRQLIAQAGPIGVKAPTGNPMGKMAPMMPSTPTSAATKVTAAINKATEQSKTKKTDPEAALKLALQKNPMSADNYLNLADFYVSKQDWTQAKATLATLTQVKPDHAQSYYFLTMLYLREQDKKNAQLSLNLYAKKNPSDTTGIQKLKKAIQSTPAPTKTSPPKPTAAAVKKGTAPI